MDAAPAHALDDVFLGHRYLDHVIQLDAGVLERVGLRNGAGKAIEQIAIGAVRLLQAILDQPDDDVVGYQTAARSMSPVEIWGIPYFWVMNAACVPFPAPGGPRSISRM
jgi:hypothetical protein